MPDIAQLTQDAACSMLCVEQSMMNPCSRSSVREVAVLAVWHVLHIAHRDIALRSACSTRPTCIGRPAANARTLEASGVRCAAELTCARITRPASHALHVARSARAMRTRTLEARGDPHRPDLATPWLHHRNPQFPQRACGMSRYLSCFTFNTLIAAARSARRDQHAP